MQEKKFLPGRELKAELVRRDIGVAELARRIHKSRQYVGGILNGRRAIKRDVAEMIAMRTGIPLRDIFPEAEEAVA